MNKSKINSGTIVLLVLFFTLILCNYFQYQLTPLAPKLMEQMHLTPPQFSSVFSSPMIPAILLGIVGGVLSDKFGVKKVTTVGLVITMVGLLCRPFTTNYTSLLLSMIAAGIGVTFINVNMSKIMGGWYPPEKIGTMVGLAMVGSTLGMTLGTATTAYFPSITSAFWFSGIVSVIVLVVWILFMKDGKTNAESNDSTDGRGQSIMESIKIVSKSKNIWLVGLCLMCVLGCNVSIASFLPAALQSRGINESSSGIISSALTLGSLVGTFTGPILIAKSKRMKPWLILFGIFTGVGAMFAWELSVVPAVILLLITGFGMGALIPVYMSFPMILPEIGPIYAGSAGGVITTLELLGAVLIPSYIITPIAGNNFNLYFILAGAVMIVMLIFVLLLPELNKKAE